MTAWVPVAVAAGIAAWGLALANLRGKRGKPTRLARLLAAHQAEEQLRDRYAPYIAQALADESEYLVRDQDQAIRIVSSWPCDHENGWCTGECGEQQPRGRHHADPWAADMERRYRDA